MTSIMPLPKYHQVYLVLREQVCEGQFQAGLPSEQSLQQQFGVARVTVRRALEQLAAEGLISREPGRGTRPVHASLLASNAEKFQAGPRKAQLTGLLENLVTMGLSTSVKVLDVQHIAATAEVARALRIGAGEAVQKAIRLRSTKAGPFSHITTYVPEAIGAHFGRKELARKPILLLLEEAGVRVGRAEQTLSARLADAQIAHHLDIAVGSALLAVRRLIFDVHERPVQWLHGLYRPDRYEYVMQLSRVGDIDAKVWVSKDLSAHFH
jgi:GntR family transcriptional regulator